MTNERLPEVRRTLLALHKALVDRERAEYEKAHGPVSPGEMLQLLISGEEFSWLHPISELIVRIDELIGNANERRRPSPARPAINPQQAKVEADALIAETRLLLASDQSPGRFRERYIDLLQLDPGLVLMHQAVMSVLPRDFP